MPTYDYLSNKWPNGAYSSYERSTELVLAPILLYIYMNITSFFKKKIDRLVPEYGLIHEKREWYDENGCLFKISSYLESLCDHFFIKLHFAIVWLLSFATV